MNGDPVAACPMRLSTCVGCAPQLCQRTVRAGGHLLAERISVRKEQAKGKVRAEAEKSPYAVVDCAGWLAGEGDRCHLLRLEAVAHPAVSQVAVRRGKGVGHDARCEARSGV